MKCSTHKVSFEMRFVNKQRQVHQGLPVGSVAGCLVANLRIRDPQAVAAVRPVFHEALS